ncbi:RNA polymerase sigma factor [Neobacillus niacini]|uniref:RNA polymerase sigma factor n=1 Tax=Neobacillus niacini TaxID=86668 RepID=UPI0021CB41E5|nr:sigma-70 family RNA polymerase sigma factor [Neobacillus niacini]MCM3766388.1 sigma-70 family RNA polymerase sigma factor [Neobacillus niacini]
MARELDIKKAQKGDKKAFVVIVKDIEDTLYKVAKSILHNDDDCADALQEAILKAYSSIHNLRDVRIFKTWMVRIVMNCCYDILRKNKKVVPIQEWMEQGTPDDRSDFELTDALKSLEEDLRVPVTLYYLKEWSVREIAQALDIPDGTVKSRLSRARMKLSEYLNPKTERSVFNAGN